MAEEGRWHAHVIKEEAGQYGDSPRTYVILSRWSDQPSGSSGGDPSFDLRVTDGTQAWTGNGLKQSASSKSTLSAPQWIGTAFRAFTEGTSEGGPCGMNVQVAFSQITSDHEVGVSDLKIQWRWEAGRSLTVRSELEEPLEGHSKRTAGLAILDMMKVLVKANKASANAEAERKVATERLSEYKAGEERRTHAVLAKCTKLLNEKKRKIQSLKH